MVAELACERQWATEEMPHDFPAALGGVGRSRDAGIETEDGGESPPTLR